MFIMDPASIILIVVFGITFLFFFIRSCRKPNSEPSDHFHA